MDGCHSFTKIKGIRENKERVETVELETMTNQMQELKINLRVNQLVLSIGSLEDQGDIFLLDIVVRSIPFINC